VPLPATRQASPGSAPIPPDTPAVRAESLQRGNPECLLCLGFFRLLRRLAEPSLDKINPSAMSPKGSRRYRTERVEGSPVDDGHTGLRVFEAIVGAALLLVSVYMMEKPWAVCAVVGALLMLDAARGIRRGRG
jgi:hypothetical protein